jgi:hypothetical protein
VQVGRLMVQRSRAGERERQQQDLSHGIPLK